MGTGLIQTQYSFTKFSKIKLNFKTKLKIGW